MTVDSGYDDIFLPDTSSPERLCTSSVMLKEALAVDKQMKQRDILTLIILTLKLPEAGLII